MKVNENTNVSMPIKNMIGIIVAVAMGIFAYTEVTARLTSLETSRELFEADLLKKSHQLPVDQEQFMLLEDLYKTVEKIEKRIFFFDYTYLYGGFLEKNNFTIKMSHIQIFMFYLFFFSALWNLL